MSIKFPVTTYKTMEQLGAEISTALNVPVVYDNEVALLSQFVDGIRRGTKVHTMKIHQEGGNDAIRIPRDRTLPLKEKTDMKDGGRHVGDVSFSYVEINHWGSVKRNPAYARGDGFQDQETFIRETEALFRDRFGKDLKDETFVSLYHFKSVQWV